MYNNWIIQQDICNTPSAHNQFNNPYSSLGSRCCSRSSSSSFLSSPSLVSWLTSSVAASCSTIAFHPFFMATIGMAECKRKIRVHDYACNKYIQCKVCIFSIYTISFVHLKFQVYQRLIYLTFGSIEISSLPKLIYLTDRYVKSTKADIPHF